MRANLSRGEIRGNPPRSSLCRSLLNSSLDKLRAAQEEICFRGCMWLWLLRSGWQLREVSRKRPWTSFYPCRWETGHPILYAHKAPEAFSGATPSILRFPRGRPAWTNGPLTPTLIAEEQRQSQHLNQAGFNWAPSGKMPSST